MTKKEFEKIVGQVADQFNKNTPSNVRWRGAEASLYLLTACNGTVEMWQALFVMIEGYYDCYYYGEGTKNYTDSEFVQGWKKTEYGEFLVKYARKIAFGLCAEDTSELEGYIDEIIAYKNGHTA